LLRLGASTTDAAEGVGEEEDEDSDEAANQAFLGDNRSIEALKNAKETGAVIGYTTAEKVFGAPWRALLLDLLIEDRVAFLVIDEGHTINTWGRTFRPKLAALGEMLDSLVEQANGRRRRRPGSVGHLRRPTRLVVTATCAPHAEQVLARSFSLQPRAQGEGEEDEPVMTLRAPSRRFNIELNTLELQNGGGAKTVCDTLFQAEADQTQGERSTSIVFAGTVSAACSLVEKLREGSQLGGDAYDVMHSKLTSAEKGAVLTRLMSSELRALIGTAILQMGIDASGVLRVLFSHPPLSLEELYQAMGRAGRGTPLTATVEIVFDIKSVSGCLALIAGDPTGLANFIAVIELLVDYEYCKHSFLSQALGDVNCLARARPRERCCSACTAACLEDPGFVCVDVTERVKALCAVVECFLLVTGTVPTVSRLLDASSKNHKTNWAGEEKSWARRKTRAFLIFCLIGLRRLRILRFAPTEDPAPAGQAKFASAPVAVNSTALDDHVRTQRRIVIRFPNSLAPKVN
jgi:hypothetical protein